MTKEFHLIIGDTLPELGNYAQFCDSSAYLIDCQNINDDHSGTAYTSLGDLSGVDELFWLLSKTTEITYHPPKKWSDKKSESNKYSMAWFTIHYIKLASNLYNIKTNYLPEMSVVSPPVEYRQTESTQLWVGGCSTTFGIGVRKDQRYANIIAEKFNLPVSVLARPGAANVWIADQLLRSDIRSGDIVVFGVTTYNRITIFNNHQLYHVNTQFLSDHKNDFPELNIFQLESDSRIYDSLSAIDEVINFCSKQNAKLILIGIHANLELSVELSKYPNFVFCHGKFGADFRDGWKDVGDDVAKHPGPKTHQMYADLIISKATQLGFI